MTELIVRTLAAKPVARLARPSALGAFALAIAYGVGLWLQVIHHLEGGTERGEPAFFSHWLRDSTLSLPLVFFAVWIGILIARRVIERADAPAGLAAAVLATAVAVVASLATALGGPAHAYLFEAQHGGHELSPLAHLGRDGLIALTAALPIAAATSALLLRRRPWAAPRVADWLSAAASERRAVVTGFAVMLVVAPVVIFASSSAQLATAQSGPGTPCPSQAPVKSYDVRAIDVDIPLNRFGDHDPQGKMYVLEDMVDDVRAQAASRDIQLGLRDDPIQPLVIRANLGDCVEITFTNDASGGEYGVHIDGLAFQSSSSGDAVGRNASSAVRRGETRTYRYWVPREPEVEGTHYIRPGPGNRQQVSHGLFGALSVEPAGSTYHHPDTGEELASGWEAVIKPAGKKAFREYVKVYHEVGDEQYEIPTAGDTTLPVVDDTTGSYRPGSRAINYRSEPFMHRLEQASDQKALAYNSYTFGDPATPIMRGYVGDPTKIRVVHGGSEMFHIYHLHGGGIRWRQNPKSDPTFSYEDVGLNKHPQTQNSPSTRLDSQAFGPGQSYSMEIEGGAGGVQQTVGDLLEHCHIAEHYVSGMWSFWRVYNTRQPDLRPLGDRAAPPEPVDSAGLIGKTMPDGSEITAENLEDWVQPMFPTRGVPRDRMDASVWDWTREGNVIFGEPQDSLDNANWPNLPHGLPDQIQEHPTAYPGDRFGSGPNANRPKVLFNPVDGRPAYPLLRTHLGRRAPFSPNGHSGAPFLGERGNQSRSGSKPDPYARRPDGICPQNSPNLRRYNVTTIQTPVPVTRTTSGTGQIFVLSKDKTAVRNGDKPAEPLAIRANVGDCVALTLTSEQPDLDVMDQPTRANMHIHHVQFDVQGSDGASVGMVYDQSVRPYQSEDLQLAAEATAGSRTLALVPGGVRLEKFRPGVWIGVGLGTDAIEVHQIESVAGDTVTLKTELADTHAAGAWAGTEFVQYRWYPDVQLDNVFWHDHVDGIHGWGMGLVGQFIVEPPGSTYHDPVTGEQVESGTYVDIRTTNPLRQGEVEGSFREFVLWTHDDAPVTDSTINMRSEPLAGRLTSAPPSELFSSWRHGDPHTPLPRAYSNDPFVIRTINVSGNGADTFRVDGHRFVTEGTDEATPIDTVQYGISERFSAILRGGAGGPNGRPGDYLYMNGIGRRLRQGAWGLIRVLEGRVPDLQPLPGREPNGPDLRPRNLTGGPPPANAGPGNPCPSGAPTRMFEVSAVEVSGAPAGKTLAYVRNDQVGAVLAGAQPPEPLVLHVAEGECLDVRLTNRRATERASFHASKLERTAASAGVNVGFNDQQTLAPGETRTYRYYADDHRVGSAPVGDFGDVDSGARGLYGAIVVAPRGATFTDPATGAARDTGARVDVHVPGQPGYRDFTLLFGNDEVVLGENTMPYPEAVEAPVAVNYQSTPRPVGPAAFSSQANGDPSTPLLQAYAGDPVRVHAIGAPGSEATNVFSLGGLSWPGDPFLAHSQEVTTTHIGAWQTADVHLVGGAGGRARATGDYFYGDMRRPFTEAGMWGLLRVVSDRNCPIQPLDGLDCVGEPSLITNEQPRPQPGGGGSGPANENLTSAPAPAAPQSGDAPDVLRQLFAPRRMSIRTLTRRGVPFRVVAPRNSKVLSVRLVRPTQRIKRRRVRGALIARGTVRLHRGGFVSRRFKLTRRGKRLLRAGRYRLEVQAGASPRRLEPTKVTRTIRLTGRPVRARRR